MFGLLLNQFWSKSCDSGLVRKPRCYSFLHKQVMLPDYVRRSHQSDLSKTSKHWNIFLSHCRLSWWCYGFISISFPFHLYISLFHTLCFNCALPRRLLMFFNHFPRLHTSSFNHDDSTFFWLIFMYKYLRSSYFNLTYSWE